MNHSNHNDGWMNGWSSDWSGGGMWIFAPIGVAVVVLLVIVVIKKSKK
jgi:uncharacterized membrane protein